MVKCQFCEKEVGKGDITSITDSETLREVFICLDCDTQLEWDRVQVQQLEHI